MKFLYSTHKGRFPHFSDEKGVFAGCIMCGKKIRDISKKSLDEHLKVCNNGVTNEREETP